MLICSNALIVLLLEVESFLSNLQQVLVEGIDEVYGILWWHLCAYSTVLRTENVRLHNDELLFTHGLLTHFL